MNLWLCSHFLVAGLFLSTSALTPEECQPLVEPLSLDDPSMMFGKTYFLVGYTDNDVYNAILNATQSFWINFEQSASTQEIMMSEGQRVNGSCLSKSVKINTEGNTGSGSYGNVSSTFHLLPSCDGCVLMSMNSTARDLDKMMEKLNLHSDTTGEEVNIRGLYLTSKNTTLKDSDLKDFKQQATCLGFSGEPNFIYNPKNKLCAEGEGIKMTF